jgi:probable F420-dependent oxidoreductase
MLPHNPFRFGVVCTKAESRRHWVDKVRRVESLGYQILLVPDHLGDQIAPLPALMCAADATSTLRVGTLVLDNDFRHPAVLAQDAATVDVLSEGRFELGLGAGWMREEYDQAGVAFEPGATRVQRLEEALRVVKGLWREGRASVAGKHYTITDLDGRPKPVQRPRPPILVGGGGKRILTIAGREADIVGIVPRSRVDGSGLDLTDVSAEAADDKVSWIQAAAGPRAGSLELNTLIQAVVVSDDGRDAAAQLARRWKVSAETVLNSPYVLIGSTGEIGDAVHARRERYGISYYAVFESAMESWAARAPGV